MRARRLTFSFCAALLLALTAASGAVAAPYAGGEAGMAELAASPTAVPAPGTFGAENADARIVLSARGPSWVKVADAAGKVLFQRTLQAGESYRVPNREGLLLTTGSARVLDVLVDGKPAPSLGALGAVRRGVPLDPAGLLAGAYNVAPKTKARPVALVKPAPAAPAKPHAPAVARPAKPRGAAKALATVIPPNGTVRHLGHVGRSAPLEMDVDKGTLLRLDKPAATVFVADPEVADVQVKSPTLIYVFGKRPGQTVLYAVDKHEHVLLNTTISVNHNLGRLREALANLLPDNRVEVASIDGAIVLSGTVQSATDAENVRRLAQRFAPADGEIVNQLAVTAPNQINLRVRITEVSRDVFKAFGFNIEAAADIGEGAIAFATGNDIARNAAGEIIRGVADNGSLLGNFLGSYRGDDVSIDALIDALATEGLITVLAEPNLTAMSGETASFLAGGEFPIPVSTDDESVSIEFKEFGVSLAFTPTILDNGRINLHVRPEVSQISTVGAIRLDNIAIPALTTRRAETTVELGSGQSFAIAGLLQNNSSQDISKIPALGDIPILGNLFRSDRFRRNETELVIIVTPYVVEPVSSKALASPLDGFTPPTDIERILGGKNYHQRLTSYQEAPRLDQGRGLIGPTGFELE